MIKSVIKSIALLSLLVSLVANAQTLKYYSASDSIFTNPERGFYHANPSLDFDDLKDMLNNQNISLAYYNFALDDFKDTFIPAWYLRKMEDDFAKMRRGGIKSIIRFTYTEKATPPYGDAPIDVVLNHISQLKPVLQNNADVIFVVQAGFIGTWGEWYYTDYYSSSPGVINDEQMEWRRQITHALLDALPDRMVQLRTPFFKKNMVPLEEYIPLNEEEAFQNNVKSRLAHHNDCFLASTSDYGTYQNIELEKAYLEDDSKYTMVGGETCNENYLSVCENALFEMDRFHWTYLNRDYHSGVINQWIDGGCYQNIQKQLGYRYRLISSEISDTSKPGGILDFDIKIINDGWANITNERPLYVVLKKEDEDIEYEYEINTDPRIWPLNDTIRLNFSAGVPGNILEGNYDTYLNFPDAKTSIKNRSEYKIRFANQNTWEKGTGYNSLLHEIIIDASLNHPPYEGSDFFKSIGKNIDTNVTITIDGLVGDWDDIPDIYFAKYDDSNETNIKVYNNREDLYFVLQSLDLNTDWRLYIDADDNPATGYQTDIWNSDGADFIVENGQLFGYAGMSNSWEWTYIQDIDYAINVSVIELKIPVVLNGDPFLDYHYSIAFDKNFSKPDINRYFPFEGEEFIHLSKNVLFQAPEFVKVKPFSNKTLVYWSLPDYPENTVAEVERAYNNGVFKNIYTSIQSTECAIYDSYSDTASTLSYRVRFTDGADVTDYLTSNTIVVDEDKMAFAYINIDGDSMDWYPVKPIFTEGSPDFSEIRLFNNDDALFYSINANEINNYEIYLSENDENQFKISNDSLFKFLDSTWEFVEICFVQRNQHFIEGELSFLSLFESSVAAFYVNVQINNNSLPLSGNSVYHIKYNTVSVPYDFEVIPSVDNPYTSLKLKWKPNSKVDGYILERSVGDSLQFELYEKLSNNSFYYLEDNLDSAQTYFYRIYGYSDIVRSPYSHTVWLQPNGISSIDEFETDMKVFPNPVRSGRADIEIYSLAYQDIEIILYNSQGKKVKDIYKGAINGQQFIGFNQGELHKGIYFIQLKGKKKTITNKLVIL